MTWNPPPPDRPERGIEAVSIRPFPVLKINKSAVLGTLIWVLTPWLRNQLLETWPSDGPAGRLRGLLFRVLIQRVMNRYYDLSTSTSEREALKDLCIGREQGIRWAIHYADMGFPDEFTDRIPMFRMLEERLHGGDVSTVHQVASSSAREIAYFA